MGKIGWFIGIIGASLLGYWVYTNYIAPASTRARQFRNFNRRRFNPIQQTMHEPLPHSGIVVGGRSYIGSASPKINRLRYKQLSMGGSTGNLHGNFDVPIRQSRELRPPPIGTESPKPRQFNELKRIYSGDIFYA